MSPSGVPDQTIGVTGTSIPLAKGDMGQQLNHSVWKCTACSSLIQIDHQTQWTFPDCENCNDIERRWEFVTATQ